MKTIECEEQGLGPANMNSEDVAAWVEFERSFWDGKVGLDRDLPSGVNKYPVRVVQYYRELWTRVLKDCIEDPPNYALLDDTLSKAKNLEIVLGHGAVGKNIEALVNQNEIEVAQRLALIFSDDSDLLSDSPQLRNEFAALRAVFKFNPRLGTETKLHTVGLALERVSLAEKTIVAAQAALDTFVDTRRKEIDELADLYRTKLLLEGPAEHWAAVAKSGMRTVWITLAVFTVMLAIPTVVVWENWPSISAYLDKTMQAASGGFSLASIVVFTIPILAYGWLLKHISRIFSQALLISADASHRKVMAVTFLGLAQNKSLHITEQDRALVLNALFRPIASANQDDGPPAGLLELIRR